MRVVPAREGGDEELGSAKKHPRFPPGRAEKRPPVAQLPEVGSDQVLFKIGGASPRNHGRAWEKWSKERVCLGRQPHLPKGLGQVLEVVMVLKNQYVRLSRGPGGGVEVRDHCLFEGPPESSKAVAPGM
jgi:hypothetical protein